MAKRSVLNVEAAIRHLRQYRQYHSAKRGKVETISLTTKSQFANTLFNALVLFLGLSMGWALVAYFFIVPHFMSTSDIVTFPLLFFPATIFNNGDFSHTLQMQLAGAIGLELGFPFFLLYLILPLVKSLPRRFLPKWHPLSHTRKTNSPSRHALSVFALAWLLATLITWPSSQVVLSALFPNTTPGIDWSFLASIPLLVPFKFFAIWIVIILILHFLTRSNGSTSTEANTSISTRSSKTRHDAFRLFLGLTTGALIKRHHQSGLASHQPVVLSEKDAALNLLILGGIGEGKTTAVIHSLLIQLLDQACGGLIFDVKGSFHRSVLTLADKIGREIILVGPGRQAVNLMAGLSPENAAAMMSSIFLMMNGNKDSSFWVNQAANLCRGALGLLHFLPAHYNLVGLQKFIFEDAFREEIECQLNLLELSDYQRKLLAGYQASLTMFDDTNERMQSDIRAAASSALSYFTHPDIQSSFCSDTNDTLHLEQVLDGKIILLDMAKATYGQASRVIHALIKMRWFQTMEERRLKPDWNQDRMVFFMCDEYQSLITVDPSGNSLNDMNFWDKSRDTKAIGIISAQGLSSFYSAIGHRDFTKTVLQNFRQKLCFKTEDDETLKYLQSLAGQARIAQLTESKQQGSSRSSNHSQSSSATTQSLTYTKQEVVDAQLMRNLEANQVLSLLNIEQQSMDDILDLQPIYL